MLKAFVCGAEAETPGDAVGKLFEASAQASAQAVHLARLAKRGESKTTALLGGGEVEMEG